MEFFWLLTVFGIVAAFTGTYYLFKSLQRLGGKFKEGLTWLFLASLFGLASHLSSPYFGFTGLDYASELWNVAPIAFTMAMVLVVLSFRSLLALFEELS